MPASALLVTFLEKLLAQLTAADTYLFLKINTVWTHPFLDSVFPWWREANAWIPLYLFLVIFGILNFKTRFLPWLLFIAATITLSDQLSSTVIKNWVARPRPCRDEFLMSQVRLLLNNCSGTYSFTSSHAANHFAFAMFLFLTLQNIFKKRRYLFFIWAATISYAQVYVGIHYPLDVLAGGILGCVIGWLAGTFYNKKIGVLQLDPQTA
ncbi:MAG: phosphatase family protein [Sediminibacterium sp.]|nr:phosphatase family protein [Sediminibacterium sp.]